MLKIVISFVKFLSYCSLIYLCLTNFYSYHQVNEYLPSLKLFISQLNNYYNSNASLFQISTEFRDAAKKLDTRALILKEELLSDDYSGWKNFVTNIRNVSKEYRSLSRNVNNLIINEHST